MQRKGSILCLTLFSTIWISLNSFGNYSNHPWVLTSTNWTDIYFAPFFGNNIKL